MVLAVLIAPAAEAAPWTFTDVTAAAGVLYEHGYLTPAAGSRPQRINTGGVAAGDYDGDGFVDLYAVRGDIGPNLLFRNRGDGTFEEVGAAAGVALAGRKGTGAIFADYDGDAHLDLLVLGGGREDAAPEQPVLFRNLGDGTFADVTAASGIVSNRDSVSAAFGDYDRDGDLDLFITHWGDNSPPGPTQHLWRNDGDGSFTDVSAAAGISPAYTMPGTNEVSDLSFSPSFADIDNDGWPDLLVTGDFETSQVFLNDRDGTFSNVTDAVISDQNGMGGAVGDYDGDGNLDWFVSSIWDPDQDSMGNNWFVSGNRLYRGRGDGTFEDATDAAGVREGYWGWGSTFQDLDNDGDLDLFHVNGWNPDDPEAHEFHLDPARAFISNGDGTFTQRAEELGLADTGQGRGVVAFDYDRDGDVDLFISNNQGTSRLYRNDGGNQQNYLAIKLRGRAPNSEAIGARIRVTAGGKTQMREIRAGDNYVSQDPAEAHFGLDTAAAATEVEIVWPDGKHKFLGRTRANQRVVVEQPPPDVDEQDEAQKRCILALNRGGAKIAAAVTRRFARCIRDAGAGRLPAGQTASQCLADDPRGVVAAAVERAERSSARVCIRPPSFGPRTAAEVGAAMLDTLRVEDVFGPLLDSAVIDAAADRAGAACQAGVADGLAALVRVQITAFNNCKAHGLAAGDIRSTADLRGCVGADAGGRVARKVASVQRRVERLCDTTAIADAFPGKCAGTELAGLAACIATQASCGVCTALAAADRTSSTCHRFTDGVAAGADYCGDEPVTTQSVARQWNEELLDAIRRDTPRPTVHARNLFHLSGAMWDAWRAYGGGGSPWLSDESYAADDPARAREIAISFAAYRVLAARFASSVGKAVTLPAIDERMNDLGFDVGFTDTAGDSPAAVGNRIGAAVLAFGATDGANEVGSYSDPTYAPVNAPMIVKQPGTVMLDPNRWQPLALDLIITQNGIPLPDRVQTAVGAGWNAVVPFALTRDDPDDVYIDPGPPPQLGGAGDAGYKEGGRQVIELSSWLDPADGVMVDRSPGAFGNNPLGTNDGTGHPVNPVTGLPYEPNLVPRGDWARVLAEFWADGPASETPPGHWNVLANEVSDHPGFEHRIGGSGPLLDRLEWDVKLYLALNGAVHDAAIVAWGLKREYDSVRPISMIRHMGGLGQSSDPGGPSYHPSGLPLQPGLIEVITAESSAPGERHEHLAEFVGEVATRQWMGPVDDPEIETAGVGWRRAVEWMPYQLKTFVTPAFPGYVSGHSTFSRAAAEVMTLFTGSAFVPGGIGRFTASAGSQLHVELGPGVDVELQWATYYDAADQAGLSRLYGGIHVYPDDFNGRIAGSLVGIGAFDRAMEYFAGPGAP
ncbi:MAG: FG-GAP-like repeat-containing protein [Thermodesulfobacteriota bacterium]